MVIPIHNGEQYLQETLECVFGHTCSDYETICEDEGSTDGLVSFLQRYGDRVSIFQNVPTVSSIAEKTDI